MDYGENKVQEAVEKWTEIKKKILMLDYTWSENYKLIK
jgi:uncharacterized pyridoxal phosphate-containing UPF0001 family protein